jgi:hypothetical protein
VGKQSWKKAQVGYFEQHVTKAEEVKEKLKAHRKVSAWSFKLTGR